MFRKPSIRACLLPFLLLVLFVTGCSRSGMQTRPAERSEVAVYRVASPTDLKVPAENHHRFGVLPYTLPPRTMDPGAQRFEPVFQIQMSNSRVADIARRISETRNFSSFVSSDVADQRLNFIALGTFSELVQQLGQQSNATVHVNEELGALHVIGSQTAHGHREQEGFSLKQGDSLHREVGVVPGFFSE